ncbi:MAG TPA: adenylate/guanylate cyclase domain-containing protein [Gaiellaceae bacterium]|nr:adenylate/guanylate cyclase domain-containing protein [Gaiellaceae bacterium]
MWVALALAAPVGGLLLLLAAPDLDVRWEHHPSHFWLVLAAAGVSAALAVSTGGTARRRGDARLFLVSLAFLSAAGALGLHALATPGVLLDTSNLGFAISTPLGLLLASVFAAASALEHRAGTVGRLRLLQPAVLGLLLVWAVVSLALLPQVEDPAVPERGSAAFAAPAVLAIALYGLAVARYLRLYARRPSGLVLAVAAAFVLLAEAALATAAARNWQATWWEWHLLMLAAFALVAWAARQEWHEERYADLYLDETRAGEREVSVLFADLAGFTPFSERHDTAEVTTMLNAYFAAVVPEVESRGGDVELTGDSLMAVFASEHHAKDAAEAALALQRAATRLAASHPDWPRFRAGVNSGPVTAGVLGTTGGRKYSVVGDTVNLASRIEGLAPPGEVAIGAGTTARLGARAYATKLGDVTVKGKRDPVEVHLLHELRSGGAAAEPDAP